MNARLEPEDPGGGQGASINPEPPSRILALDVGNRRIGLAITDPLGYTAQPLFTIQRADHRADLKSIGRVVRRYGVAQVVVGLPLHSSGEMSAQALKVQALVNELREQHPEIPIELLDERLTTAEAHHLLDRARTRPRSKQDRQGRTAIIDQIAAVLILEAFLSRLSPQLLPPPLND